MKEYKRDNRSPVPKDANVSKMMSANKAKHTKPELAFRRALFAKRVTGYRLHYKRIPGRPDLVFVSKKLAIFINGCFWHRCPICNLPVPRHNTEFWSDKFKRNTERDQKKISDLQAVGWRVIVIWECELSKDVKLKVKEIEKALRLNK
jgi:DNA mismatch endonuclease, patch repair protein